MAQLSRHSSPLLPLLLLFFIVMAFFRVSIASRKIPAAHEEQVDKKQPEWLHEHDGSFLIPGFGRVMVPPFGSIPNYGGGIGIGNVGTPPTRRRYIPGGDDTTIPNPGVEVPYPGGGGVPSVATP